MDTCWYVYIVECSDQSFYTGVTTELSRRIEAHNLSPLGAKYTRARRPVSLIYSQEYPTHSAALKEEIRIKKLSKEKKINLCKGCL